MSSTENLNYYSAGIDEYKKFLEYAIGLEFKDSAEANSFETDKSLVYGNAYISARLDLQNSSSSNYVKQYHENTKAIYDNPQLLVNGKYELNEYYRNLYVGKGIDILLSRTAADFDIIGESYTSLSEAYRSLFKSEYAKNIVYFKKTMYTDGFGGSNNSQYRSFVRFFVVWMSIQSTLDTLRGAEGFNVELMDDWSIKNMLYSYGVTFLDDLSISHQRLIVSNLVDLFNKKGSSSVFSTIFQVFGFDNMEAFRYYLTKSYNKDDDGNVDFTSPDLKFLKVPYDEVDFEKYISTLTEDEVVSIQEDFDKIIQDDPTWKATKEDILEHEFNYVQSKYFDLQSAVDMYKHSTNIAFLYELINTIKYDRPNDDLLYFIANDISDKSIEVLDCLIAMHVVTMEIIGYDASIPQNVNNFRTIYGFRHDDLDPSLLSDTFWSNFADSNFITLSSLNSGIDRDEVSRLLETNLILKDKLEKLMRDETDYDKYTDLAADYKLLFLSNSFKEIFGVHTEYIGYLNSKNVGLADFVTNAITNTTENEKRTALNKLAIAIENYFNSEYVLPTHLNTDYTLGYIRRLINNFKAYTVELNEITILFRINSPFEKLKFFDKVREFLVENSVADCIKLVNKVFPSVDFSINDEIALFVTSYNRIEMSEITSLVYEYIPNDDSIELPSTKYLADRWNKDHRDTLLMNTDRSNNELVYFDERIIFEINEGE